MKQTEDTYNRGGLIAFLFSLIVSLGFFIYVGLIHPGIDLKELPAEALSAPAQAASPDAAPAASNGMAVYKANCAVCHGDAGRGDGPAGKALVPPARNLVEGKWKQGGSSVDLFNTITKGMPGTSMAAFGQLPLADRWALVDYIRSITENKTPDDAAKLEAFKKTAK